MAVIRRHVYYKEEFMRLYGLGLNDSQIGKELGQLPQIVYNWRQKYGLPANQKQHTNEVSKHSDTIARMYSEGATDDEIGAAIGMSRCTVLLYRKKTGMPAHRTAGKRRIRMVADGS